MSVRVKNYNGATAITKEPVVIDTSIDQRETTVDGYTFHWGPNEVRNFLDDGVGLAHAAFGTSAGSNPQLEIRPFNNARS